MISRQKSALLYGLMLSAVSSLATAAETTFNIPPQPMPSALRAFGVQSGVPVVFSASSTGGGMSPGVVGTFSPDTALARILAGSPLRYVSVNGGFAIVAREDADTAAKPPIVRVATAQSSQAAAPPIEPEPAAPGVVEEVVVTGSRLTSGFETATPVTAISAEKLLAASPTNISDALRQLPALSGTLSGNSTVSGTGGSNGQSLLNLRNLGTNRNLVLLNGRRTVSTNTNNSVDLSLLPQNLISRVDVVTGGASATYGSDAVAGVVNLILDTKFSGFKGEIGGGISTYGDVPNFRFAGAYGRPFADDRGHLILSTQYFRQEGTSVNDVTGRDWWDKPQGLIANTTGAGPQNLVLPNIRSSIGTTGGLITNTVLRGTHFLAGGAPATFNRGLSSGSAWQSGGDGALINFNLTPDQQRTSNFAHLTYDVGDNAELYGELAYSESHGVDRNQKPINTGARFTYTIFSGNPYLPAAIQAAMTANNIASFQLGRYMLEYPDVTILTDTRVARGAVGMKGTIGEGWDYDLSYSYGRSTQRQSQSNLTIARPTFAAADAVRNPATGQIVCRSQFYVGNTFVPGGTGMDPGCKPQNLFGPNSVAADTIPYTIGDSWRKYRLDQHVWTATISGDLGDFNLGAGPIAVAGGAEYRTEKGDQVTDDVSGTTIDFTGIRGGPAGLQGQVGPFRFANFQPFKGEYNVKEVFGEVGIPLLRDAPLAESLSVDGALRYTNYSTSGGVTTWKVGLDYKVIPDVRFRATVSRDIRAPNLLELYNSATQNTGNAFYPSTTTGIATPRVTIASGNPLLTPERALTQTYGVVLSPRMIEGLQVSLDYYDIEIEDGISTIGPQETIDNCFLGVPGFCQYVFPSPGSVLVKAPFLNLASIKNAGFDYEARYRTDWLNNPLELSLLATQITKASTQAVGAPELSTLGGNNDPEWRVNFRGTYDVSGLRIVLQERYISPKLVDAQREEGVYVDDNTVDAAFYTDLTVSYAFEAFGSKSEAFLAISNLTNQDPPKDVGPPSSFVQPGNRTVYDWMGRYFNVGLRFRY